MTPQLLIYGVTWRTTLRTLLRETIVFVKPIFRFLTFSFSVLAAPTGTPAHAKNAKRLYQ
jgi:hypothetical protein